MFVTEAIVENWADERAELDRLKAELTRRQDALRAAEFRERQSCKTASCCWRASAPGSCGLAGRT
jgi:hypothetical protein